MAAVSDDAVGARERCALIVCDVQPDLLKSLPEGSREALLALLRTVIAGARRADWTVVFTGVRFPSGYGGVSAQHRLYGGFKRLNAKMGDDKVHWFMEGFAGSDIEPSLEPREGDVLAWRQRHLPSAELLDALRTRGITKATVCGLKAAYAVQAVSQALCDGGLPVYVIREAVQDDVPERLAAMLDQLLPVYAEVISCTDFLEGIGQESLAEAIQAERTVEANRDDKSGFLYCTDCKRGGHGQRFCQYLLERPNWRSYPTQKWFQDERWQEFHCPLDKKVVDFADEPQFSRVAMYIKGREWLEEKTKVIEFAGSHMPETFIIEKGQWQGKAPPPDDEVQLAPWFVKGTDRNWGSAVECCSKPSECLGLTVPDRCYVVQQHVPNPLLMDDGRKCHIKFYTLLMCLEDAVTWSLHTYRDGYLSISPTVWSPQDTSKDTQVTIIRSGRISETPSWGAWPEAYPRCKAVAAEVVGRTVQAGKLQGRPGKRQFEVISADFIVDTDGKVWLFEFNTDPVLRDEGDAAHVDVHDGAMVRGALSIAMPWEGGDAGLWDLAGEFRGEAPAAGDA